MCVCAYVYASICAHVHACRGQRRMSGIPPSITLLPISPRKGLSLNPKLIVLQRRACQISHGLSVSAPQCCGYRHMPPCLASYVGTRILNSDPHAHTKRTFLY